VVPLGEAPKDRGQQPPPRPRCLIQCHPVSLAPHHAAGPRGGLLLLHVLLQCPRRQRPSPTVMRSSGQPGELARGRREPIDLHPGLGLPRAQLPDDCPVREEHGRFPNGGHVLGQSGGCHDVAESLPGRNPPRESANIPLTLVVPSNAGPGEDHVILTAGGPISTSGSASGSLLLASASRPDINRPREPALGVLVAARSRSDHPQLARIMRVLCVVAGRCW
jgi:hypothetical protein